MAEKKRRLSLNDLAHILDRAVDGMSKEGQEQLAALAREDPRLEEQLADLETLARDARCEWYADATMHRGRLDQLLVAWPNWRHPAEVLGTDDDIDYEELLRLAGVDAERTEDRERVLGVKKRLEGSQAEDRIGRRVFDEFVEKLLALDGVTAKRTLEQLPVHYEFRRRNPSWRPPDIR